MSFAAHTEECGGTWVKFGVEEYTVIDEVRLLTAAMIRTTIILF